MGPGRGFSAQPPHSTVLKRFLLLGCEGLGEQPNQNPVFVLKESSAIRRPARPEALSRGDFECGAKKSCFY